MSRSICIATVVGARPQFIKAAAVSRAVARHNVSGPEVKISERIVHTGQHYDENMSKVFFEELRVPEPDYNLGVGSGTHAEQTGQMLRLLEKTLIKEKPDLVLIYGDTNSTLAGALAAAKLQIPVAHVEAGLRSFNRSMPEEINRILADRISSLLFCPTDTAVKNLADEGMTQGVYQVGDVMYDCALYYRQKAHKIEAEILEKLGIRQKSYFLTTIHRAGNTDDTARLKGIFRALSEISSTGSPVILPLHPRTKKIIARLDLNLSENIRIIPPVPYLEMAALEANAKVILTDSGGVQKEAYMFSVPCVTLRDETEWVETVKAGWNRLAGADSAKIIEAVTQAVNEPEGDREAFYGDGRAGDKICKIIISEKTKSREGTVNG